MSSSDDDVERPRQRRRIDTDDNDDDDDNGTPSNAERAARMAALAQRRRRALQREVLALAGEDEVTDAYVEPRPVGDSDTDDDDNDNNEEEQQVAAFFRDEEEEEDGEDLMENAQRDYQRIAALDTYGTEGIDDRDYDAMDVDQRRSVEQQLNQRDKRGGRSGGFYGMLEDVGDDEEDEEARQRRRAMFRRGGDTAMDEQGDDEDEQEEFDEEDLDGEDPVNLEAFEVPLREWIAQDRTRKEIQRRFRAFLRHFQPESDRSRRRGNGIYEQKIRTMCAANLSTLAVSYQHLSDSEPVLTMWLNDAPKDMIPVLNEAATRHTIMLFPSYKSIKSQIHVRISELPILDSLRDLRRSHIDRLIKVEGVVTRRSQIYPQLQSAYYMCSGCKDIQGPYTVDEMDPEGEANMHTPDNCPTCEGPTSFRLHPTLSVYRNSQTVNLQETPGSVQPGRVPRTKEVKLTHDLVDIARPGDQIEVTGVFEHRFDSNLTIKSGFPVFETCIFANHVSKREDASSAANLSEEDVEEILKLSRDPRIADRIVQSIAPSIYGHDFCKMALAMSLFGGVPKKVNDKHRIRGDVNVLLLGDPGTSKSQLLKYAEKTAPRAVYSTGKGASAVGLTASVHKDPITKEWTLEGGALVLADKGVCLIDEFDKMNEQDRTSIHEAMEQQSISVSKAGIVTSLQARCAVIAAANPIGGRYDSANTLSDNVELTDPIIQRFDILCVIQDVVDPEADARLATFVTQSHMQSVPTRDAAGIEPATAVAPDDGIPQDLLRKYIQYARANARPVLRGNTFDQEKVSSLYVALRRESAASGGVPIAVRHIESIMRMSEAHAKMHLRDYVRDDDLDAAIRMMLGSFIQAQKFSVRRALKKSFAKFITSGEDKEHLLLHILREMFSKEQMYQILKQKQQNQADDQLERLDVPLDELESRARERKIYNVLEFCNSAVFHDAGYEFDERRGILSRMVT